MGETTLELEKMGTKIRGNLIIRVLKWIVNCRFLPPRIFAASLKTRPVCAIELVTVYCPPNGGEREVLLKRRPKNDRDFPSQWHSPGKIMRNQQTLYQVWIALAKADETSLPIVYEPDYAGTVNLPNKPRAHFVCNVFVRTFSERVKLNGGARWIPESKLGRYRLVKSHRDVIIPLALACLDGRRPQFMENLSSTD